jgi:stress-induced morphogen
MNTPYQSAPKMSEPNGQEAVSSEVTEEQIRSKLTEEFEPTHLDLKDTSGSDNFSKVLIAYADKTVGGCGQAYEAVIVSACFEKMRKLPRHRLVNTALKAEIAKIHAWSAEVYTPAEWEDEKKKKLTS